MKRQRSRKRRSAQIRAVEQSRQHDRQREEIHPIPVLEQIEALAAKPAPSLKLPPAIPDPTMIAQCVCYPFASCGRAPAMTQSPFPVFRRIYRDGF